MVLRLLTSGFGCLILLCLVILQLFFYLQNTLKMRRKRVRGEEEKTELVVVQLENVSINDCGALLSEYDREGSGHCSSSPLYVQSALVCSHFISLAVCFWTRSCFHITTSW